MAPCESRGSYRELWHVDVRRHFLASVNVNVRPISCVVEKIIEQKASRIFFNRILQGNFLACRDAWK